MTNKISVFAFLLAAMATPVAAQTPASPQIPVSPQLLEMVGQMPCQTLVTLAAAQLPPSVLEPLGQMMNANAMGGNFGSVCNMAAYLVQTCAAQPTITVKEAFGELLRMKAQRAKFPRVPQCGG